MHTRAGRIVVACCVLSAVVGIAVAIGIGAGAAPGAIQEEPQSQVLADTGRFAVGAARGAERAGFSELPKLQVFASPDDPDWPSIEQCLRDVSALPEIGAFTPILIDSRLDIESEGRLRQREGVQVVVRALSGKYLGCLRAGFTCEELVGLMRRVLANQIGKPDASPVYSVFKRHPEAIDTLVQEGKVAEAERFLELLREFEGDASPVVQAVEARLGG